MRHIIFDCNAMPSAVSNDFRNKKSLRPAVSKMTPKTLNPSYRFCDGVSVPFVDNNKVVVRPSELSTCEQVKLRAKKMAEFFGFHVGVVCVVVLFPA